MKLDCGYWTLLLISLVFSGLLCLIAASDGVPGSISKIKNKHELLGNITLADIGKNDDEMLEILNELKSDIQFKLSDNNDDGNEYSVSENSVNNDANLATTDIQRTNYLNVLKESVTQQPNLSQGISQTGQTVVLTLVDTASAELESLAEPHLSSGTQTHDSTKNLSQTSTKSVDGADSIVTIPEISVPTVLLPIDNSNVTSSDKINLLIDDIKNESKENIVVVRAEQKSIEDLSKNSVDTINESNDKILKSDEDPPKVHESLSSSGEFDNEATRIKLGSGSSEDTATVMLDGLVNSGGVQHHEDIPSFSEWAQKRLEEAEKKKTHPNASIQNPGGPGRGAGGMKVRTKNYASPDCGAKIVAVNPEARSARSVLVSTRDEYMLNTCTSKIWFVVELCEAIQAKKIELANFELFSSSPKDFSVFVSDRFPTRDWSAVGHFTAMDERDIQSFALHPHLFGKFIKIELHSHHGNEHFCPISLFRAYGTSEFEVLETETDVQEISVRGGDNRNADHNDGDDDDEDDDDIDNDGDDDDDDNDDDDDDDDDNVGSDDDQRETLDGSGNKIPRNLFGSAKDAVIRIVEKAASVLVKTGNIDINNITKVQESIGDNIGNSFAHCMTPRYTILCDNCTDDDFAKVFHLISCQSSYFDSIIKISFINHALYQSELCGLYGVNLNISNANFIIKKELKGKSSCAKNLSTRFLTSVLSSEYIIALCNVIAMEKRKLVLNSSGEAVGSVSAYNVSIIDAVTSKPVTIDTITIPQTSTICGSDVANCQSSATSITDTERYSYGGSVIENENLNTAIKDTRLPNFMESFKTTEILASQIKPTKTFGKENHKRASSVPTLEPSKDAAEETVQAEVVTTQSPLLNFATATTQAIAEPSSFVTSVETVTPTIISQLGDVNNEAMTGVESVTLKIEAEIQQPELGGKMRIEEKDEKPNEKYNDDIKLTVQEQLSLESFLSDLKDLEGDTHAQSNSAPTATPLTASNTPQQKESVFLRLSNRIKALEQNMSLSGQYLEELSRRYKKQVEEMQRSLERTTAAIGEELKKSEERESKRLEEISILREELLRLSESMEMLLYDRNSWKSKLSSFSQHIALIVVEIAVLVLIITYCRRSSDLGVALTTSKMAENKELVRRRSTESMDNSSTKKNRKRRPSEIASVISGTYRHLMIDDRLELRRERKKKHKRESLIGLTSNTATKRDVSDKIILCKRASSIDCRNETEKEPYYPKIWPNSPLDGSHRWSEQHLSNENGDNNETNSNCEKQSRIIVDEIDGNTDVPELSVHGVNDQHRLSTDINEFDKGISRSNSPKSLGFFKSAQLHSPFFMKTALRSRSMRNKSNGNNSESGAIHSDSREWYARTSKNSISGQDSPTNLTFLDSPNIDIRNNGAGSINGHYGISDDSGSGSVTPTPGKTLKKEGSLRKMVRKLF